MIDMKTKQKDQTWISGIVAVCILMPTWTIPVAFGQDTESLDVQSTLKQILQTLEKQQVQIDELRATVQRQTETIQAQQRIIDEQTQNLSVQRDQLDRAAAGGGLDAIVQYKVAMELQHVAIFDIRRREQPAYFERCIGEFRKIVTDWSASPYAAEAQYRIGKIYHRYLDRPRDAIREYQTLL
ncbi:MAG: hypothetical protein ABIH23_21010, partial [bacterium]